MTLTINLVPDLEMLVEDEAKREGLAPELYINKLLSHYLRQKKVTVSEHEATLLQQINRGLPEHIWQRLEYLRKKLQDDDLTTTQQQELIAISDMVEDANIQRIEALLQLAELRNTTIEKLMDLLAVRPPKYV